MRSAIALVLIAPLAGCAHLDRPTIPVRLDDAPAEGSAAADLVGSATLATLDAVEHTRPQIGRFGRIVGPPELLRRSGDDLRGFLVSRDGQRIVVAHASEEFAYDAIFFRFEEEPESEVAAYIARLRGATCTDQPDKPACGVRYDGVSPRFWPLPLARTAVHLVRAGYSEDLAAGLSTDLARVHLSDALAQWTLATTIEEIERGEPLDHAARRLRPAIRSLRDSTYVERLRALAVDIARVEDAEQHALLTPPDEIGRLVLELAHRPREAGNALVARGVEVVPALLPLFDDPRVTRGFGPSQSIDPVRYRDVVPDLLSRIAGRAIHDVDDARAFLARVQSSSEYEALLESVRRRDPYEYGAWDRLLSMDRARTVAEVRDYLAGALRAADSCADRPCEDRERELAWALGSVASPKMSSEILPAAVAFVERTAFSPLNDSVVRLASWEVIRHGSPAEIEDALGAVLMNRLQLGTADDAAIGWLEAGRYSGAPVRDVTLALVERTTWRGQLALLQAIVSHEDARDERSAPHVMPDPELAYALSPAVRRGLDDPRFSERVSTWLAAFMGTDALPTADGTSSDLDRASDHFFALASEHEADVAMRRSRVERFGHARSAALESAVARLRTRGRTVDLGAVAQTLRAASRDLPRGRARALLERDLDGNVLVRVQLDDMPRFGSEPYAWTVIAAGPEGVDSLQDSSYASEDALRRLDRWVGDAIAHEDDFDVVIELSFGTEG